MLSNNEEYCNSIQRGFQAESAGLWHASRASYTLSNIGTTLPREEF